MLSSPLPAPFSQVLSDVMGTLRPTLRFFFLFPSFLSVLLSGRPLVFIFESLISVSSYLSSECFFFYSVLLVIDELLFIGPQVSFSLALCPILVRLWDTKGQTKFCIHETSFLMGGDR